MSKWQAFFGEDRFQVQFQRFACLAFAEVGDQIGKTYQLVEVKRHFGIDSTLERSFSTDPQSRFDAISSTVAGRIAWKLCHA